MRQKNIWSILLSIGVISSLLSCKKIVDYNHQIHYTYSNSTNMEIELRSLLYSGSDTLVKEYTIAPHSDIKQVFYTESSIHYEFIAHSDSLIITFAEEKQSYFDQSTTSKYNPLDGSNLVLEKPKNHITKYTYNFTNEDFENAIPIE